MHRRRRTLALVARALIGLGAAGLVVLQARRAEADRVDRLVELLRSTSYKVRLQAAIGLGKLRDRPRGVPALIGALRDPNYTVRALAAAALGEIGDARALTPLKQMQRGEKHAFVLRLCKKAIAALSSAAARLKYLVRLGTIAGGSSQHRVVLAKVLSDSLLRELAKLSPVTIDPRRRRASDGKLLKAYVLDGSILEARRRTSRGNVEISCSIRVSLATHPENSMKAFYSGGAATEVPARGFRSDDEVPLFKEVLAAAAQSAVRKIWDSYLRSQ